MEKMLQSLMKRFPIFIAIGAMIVVIAVIIGVVNSANAANYYSVDKAVREASVELAQVRAGIESTIIWLPYFKFLGVAMILAGIVMALGVIGMRLQNLGQKVMASIPQSARQQILLRPKSVMLMRTFMMIGMLIIIAGFIVSLVTASTAATVFSNPITTIDGAATGSTLLNDLASVHAAESWLEAFKFFGIASFFLSIVYGLHTIVLALRFQWGAIPKVVASYPHEETRVAPAQVIEPAAAD